MSGCIRTKVVVIGRKWLFSDKMVVFGQSGCIRTKVVVFGQSGCIRAKEVVIGKKIVFLPVKVNVLGHKWLYSGKVVVFGKK